MSHIFISHMISSITRRRHWTRQQCNRFCWSKVSRNMTPAMLSLPSHRIPYEFPTPYRHDVGMVVLVEGDTNLWPGLQLCCHFLLACFHRRSHCAAEVSLHETTISPRSLSLHQHQDIGDHNFCTRELIPHNKWLLQKCLDSKYVPLSTTNHIGLTNSLISKFWLMMIHYKNINSNDSPLWRTWFLAVAG